MAIARVTGHVGDSLTAGYFAGGASNWATARCAVYLDALHPGYSFTASVAGVSGTTSADWLPNSTTQQLGDQKNGTGPTATNLYNNAVAQFRAAGVTAISIALGLNDSATPIDTATYVANIGTIVTQLQTDFPGIPITLQSPTYFVADAAILTRLQSYFPALSALARRGLSFGYAATYADFLTNAGAWLSGDDLHPNSTGHDALGYRWAQSMAISAGTVGEVRTTGSDTNGGGFLPTAPSVGADYSQQDAPQLSLTDVVTDGSSTVTSATGGFTAAMIGNLINIAGTCVMITARASSNSITVDRTLSTATGQTGKVGGAWASPGYASGQLTTSCRVWLKAGTYTITLSVGNTNISGARVASPGGTAAAPFVWEGYQTTRGDLGTKPVITASGVSGLVLMNCASAFTRVDNLDFLVPAGCGGLGLRTNNVCAIRCKTRGSGYGFYVDGVEVGTYLIDCEGLNATGTTLAPFHVNAAATFINCVAHGSDDSGFLVGVAGARFVRCKAYDNTLAGFNGAGFEADYINCTSYGNGTDGFLLSATGATGLGCVNCVGWDNDGLDFNAGALSAYTLLLNCACIAGGVSANLTNVEGLITLTADPFEDGDAGDFTLNRTAGGGVLLRGGGYPAYADVGALQHQDLGSNMAVGSHPTYAVVFYSENPLFYAGDIVPLKWSTTRADGTTPAGPTSAVVHVYDAEGALSATLTPELDPAPASGSTVLAALWTVPALASGGVNYSARLTQTIGSDVQVRSAAQWIAVRGSSSI